MPNLYQVRVNDEKSKRFYVIPVHNFMNEIGIHSLFNLYYDLGTPLYNGSVKQIIHSACREAEIYLKCGVVSN